jgi:hypothetical protein
MWWGVCKSVCICMRVRVHACLHACVAKRWTHQLEAIACQSSFANGPSVRQVIDRDVRLQRHTVVRCCQSSGYSQREHFWGKDKNKTLSQEGTDAPRVYLHGSDHGV